jgi:hypothetical protein
MPEDSLCRGQRDGLLNDILSCDPDSIRDWRAVKVCQVCGELAGVASFYEWSGAHSEGGEFVAYLGAHESCWFVSPGGFAQRDYRFCEVCRERVAHIEERQVGLSWLCEPCERRIRSSGHEMGAALDELARRRFGRWREDPPGPAPEVGTHEWQSGPRVRPPRGWLPPGLYACEDCGHIRGAIPTRARTGEVVKLKSTCLCEGITCRRCGNGRIPRPITDCYDPSDGRFWHVPYFGDRAPCYECRERERSESD